MKWFTVLLLPLVILATSNAFAKSDPKKMVADIANYIETRWDDVPVLETTSSTGGSLEGKLHYQTDIFNCFFFDELDVHLTVADLSFTTGKPKNKKLQSITAGIGKRILKHSCTTNTPMPQEKMISCRVFSEMMDWHRH